MKQVLRPRHPQSDEFSMNTRFSMQNQAALDKVGCSLSEFEKRTETCPGIRQKVEPRSLRYANIIGAMAFGPARRLTVLERLESTILVHEERREVFEATS